MQRCTRGSWRESSPRAHQLRTGGARPMTGACRHSFCAYLWQGQTPSVSGRCAGAWKETEKGAVSGKRSAKGREGERGE